MRKARFFLSLLREHLWSYMGGALLVSATVWMTLAVPFHLQQVIDLLKASVEGQDAAFFGHLVWIVSFAVAIIFTRTASRLLFFVPGRKVEFDLKNRLLAHLTTLQRGFFAENATGAIISRINNDINGVRMLMGFGLMGFFNTVATISLAPWRMYQISPRLTLYVLLPIGGVFLLMQWGVRKLRHYHIEQMTALQNLSDFTVESYSGLEALKSSRGMPWAEGRFGALNGLLRGAYVRLSNIRAFLMPILSHLVNVLKVVLLLAGGLLVVSAEMTLGGFTAYLLYLSMLVPPLMGMTFMIFVIQRGFTALESLERVFLTQPQLEAVDARLEARLAKNRLQEGLRMQDLRFAYAPGSPPVLEDVNLALRPGEVIGLFGRAGAGKTTLVNLLNGWLQPGAGQVLLDGCDVRYLSRATLRRHIATVTQEPFLFSENVLENVRFAQYAASEAQVMQALENTAMREDLTQLPQAEHTMVGEKGVTLSGGQKQRIALARALIRPASLLILDDVLSAVDPETERLLIQQIHALGRSNTSALIISHRISALVPANRIYVLENGRITAQGSHQELIARPGIYQQTWQMQEGETRTRAAAS